MEMRSNFFIFWIVVLFKVQVFGQVGLEGISSGRYEIRKAVNRKPASQIEEFKVNTEKKIESVKSEKTTVFSQLPNKVQNKLEPVQVLDQRPKKADDTYAEPSLVEQAQSLFSNKNESIYEYYREKIQTDDIRNNRLEIDILPVVAYNDSQSNYSYRDYQSYFQGLLVKSNVWFTPSIGVSGKILFSLAADVSAISDQSRLPVKYEFMELGVNVRKYFGITEQDNSLEYLILYSEYKTATPNDNISRPRLKSSGLGVGLRGRFPFSGSYSWVIGGSMFPRIQHVESQTGAAISSGESLEHVRIGFDMGGEWKLNRSNQIVWNLNLVTERNLFNGPAALVDPSTGQTPENVSAANSLVIFSLGYRWGH